MKKDKLSLKDRINQFFADHFYPTPPEEQMPVMRGMKSGWSFRFSKDDKEKLLLIMLLAAVAILVISALITMIQGG
ncbi:MAG: hypothetical protein IJ252_02875 [Solobacterium sp.]|nr:hypothetical protein [Solobacterium sp.]